MRALPPGRCRSAGPWLPGKSGQPEGSRSKDAVPKDAAAEAAAAGRIRPVQAPASGRSDFGDMPIGFRGYIARARVALETLAGPCVQGHCSPAAALERPGGEFRPGGGPAKGLVESRKSLSNQRYRRAPSASYPQPAKHPVVGPSFFFKIRVDVRRGGAYNPPIDAAPRFTGPARCHRSFSDTFWCMTLLTKVRRWSFSRPSKGGSPSGSGSLTTEYRKEKRRRRSSCGPALGLVKTRPRQCYVSETTKVLVARPELRCVLCQFNVVTSRFKISYNLRV